MMKLVHKRRNGLEEDIDLGMTDEEFKDQYLVEFNSNQSLTFSLLVSLKREKSSARFTPSLAFENAFKPSPHSHAYMKTAEPNFLR